MPGDSLWRMYKRWKKVDLHKLLGEIFFEVDVLMAVA